jgi:histidine triad (HIT) family protein
MTSEQTANGQREQCLFCRIADGRIPATVVGANEHAVAFRDLHPQAPSHLLVIPRLHRRSFAEALPNDALVGVMTLIQEVAQSEGLAEAGYRVLTNIGADGGQTVPHLHWHLLGGRALGWPPG